MQITLVAGTVVLKPENYGRAPARHDCNLTSGLDKSSVSLTT